MSNFQLSELTAGNRRALAKAITLVESTRDEHRARAQDILEQVLPHSGNSILIVLRAWCAGRNSTKRCFSSSPSHLSDSLRV